MKRIIIILMVVLINIIYIFVKYFFPHFVETEEGLIVLHMIGTLILISLIDDDLREYGLLREYWLNPKTKVYFMWIWCLSIGFAICQLTLVNITIIGLALFILLGALILSIKATLELGYFLLKVIWFLIIGQLKKNKKTKNYI